MSAMSIPCKAQFYTLGTKSQCRPVETENPSEQPKVTPRDSISLSNISQTEGEGTLSSLPPSPLMCLPLRHIRIGSKYGMRFHPIYHKNMMHNGVDLVANYEPVYSMFPGKVIRTGYDSRSGHFVTIQSANYTISYCHLSKIFVHKGYFVDAGTPFSRSGDSGASTGPHLHLTLKKDGKAMNPAIIIEWICKSYQSPPQSSQPQSQSSLYE